MKNLPSLERLNTLFTYAPGLGYLFWKTHVQTWRIGKIAGTPDKEQYLVVGVDRVRYKVHRIIWKIYYGKEPEQTIDHIDGDTSNNRIVNLREASISQNMAASKLSIFNKTGEKGVQITKGGKYLAAMKYQGQSIYLGTYETIEEAAAAYEKGARELHGQFYYKRGE